MAFFKPTATRLLDQVTAVLITFVLTSTVLMCLALIASCIGYLLTQLLPFPLFQATLLSAIIVVFVFIVLSHRKQHTQYDDFSDEIGEGIYNEHDEKPTANKTKEVTTL